MVEQEVLMSALLRRCDESNRLQEEYLSSLELRTLALQEAREAGVSVAQLSLLTGISTSVISRLTKG